MKNLFISAFLIINLCSGCNPDSGDSNGNPQEELQVTLYDKNKEAIAYIDYGEDATIYLFGGEPVAYIELEDQVYSFNGRLLGWYSDGVLYDKNCYAVGAKHGIARGGVNTVVTRAEKVKGVKQLKPDKPAKGSDSVHPVLKDSWSETALTEFFDNGER